MKYVLFLVMILFSGQAVALNCEKQPTCAELGYSTQDNPNCLDDGYLICPFDSQYKKCVNFNCESLGFTQSDKSDWCADIATCKGDKSYTLCQTPCIAWDYETLSNLASSGKCKVVTMKNDITLPPNQGITLAKNTTLDGNGHTITATSTSFTLLDGAKLKNMHINRKISSTEELTLISVQGNGFFEDISVLDENNNTVRTDKWRYLCWASGTLTLSGSLKFEVKNDVVHPVFATKLIFENANIEIISPQTSSDVLWGSEIARNSEIHIKTKSFVVLGSSESELIDSKMIVETAEALCWAEGNEEMRFKLGAGGYLDTKNNILILGGAKMRIIFSGTTEKPATLVIAKEHQANDVTLEVQNTAAKFNYMGTTYRPKQIGTTLLSDVPTSPNWEKVP